jgi:tagaturonate reductase
MRLSKDNISDINKRLPIRKPNPALFFLPERILQFGTGVFIRGLIDYIIDKSNNAGIFNGRVLAVKSTDSGNINDFTDQDSLFTLILCGVEGG